MGSEVVPLDNIKYSKDGSLGFSALSSNYSVVPIVVEMEHVK
jgi:hypothetical protein